MRENQFQAQLIKKLKSMFPGSVIMKNDPNYIQGIPDLIILYRRRWAALEVKGSEIAKHQPNQEYFVDKMDDMSFADFIYPENEDEVLKELRTFLTGAYRK